MRRIVTLIALLLAAGVTGSGVMAQRLAGVPRVGVLAPVTPEQNKQSVDDFRTGMRAVGWIDGGNVSIEVRFANGDPALLSANAAAFVAAKVDIIVAFSRDSAKAARQATSTIPIVMDTDDPIGSGLVASLPRPGGNVTGISDMFEEVAAKSLQTLKEAAPRVSKIGVLAQTGNPRYAQLMMKELEPAAASLVISLLPVGVDTAEDLPRRFDEMTAAGADGYLVIAQARTDAMRDAIAALALRHRLPGVAPMRRYADAGVLLSYGASLSAIHRREAYFVDRILKGAMPADLPVEQPTSFELVVNLKTAKALGLTVPPLILARADEVIE
jgi:putative tryptophan/tyrosine transport system substrate-binding protein